MAAITPRKNKDGSISYKAQVRVRKGGKVIHQETQTFDRMQAAKAWGRRREAELHTAEGLRAALREDPPLSHVIQQYFDELKKPLDRTKRAMLVQIKDSELGAMDVSEIESGDIVETIKGFDVAPSTRGHYLAHLSSVVRLARPVWKYPLDPQVVQDARVALLAMGVVGRSNQRDRRPTLDELDLLMGYFGNRLEGDPSSIPMPTLVAFTIFSLRRISEICRIRWEDFDEPGARVMVRDLKHPNTKIGNDTWVDLTPEAMRIVLAQPRTSDRIFPYVGATASTVYSDAIKFLEIDDLTLNDLRHEGASRLSEMGWTIQRIAAVSGHRSWNTLKRYTHVRQVGDKFAGWKWLDVVAPQRQREFEPQS
jgi:integrase